MRTSILFVTIVAWALISTGCQKKAPPAPPGEGQTQARTQEPAAQKEKAPAPRQEVARQAEAPAVTAPAEKPAPAPARSVKAKTPEVTTQPASSPASTVPAGESISLELESFELTNCRVEDLPDAGGGKAVLFPQEDSKARTQVTLSAGRYEVTAYMFAQDGGHDACLISIADAQDLRQYPSAWGKVAPSEAFWITVRKTGPVTVVVRPAETDFMVDRIVIKPVGTGLNE